MLGGYTHQRELRRALAEDITALLSLLPSQLSCKLQLRQRHSRLQLPHAPGKGSVSQTLTLMVLDACSLQWDSRQCFWIKQTKKSTTLQKRSFCRHRLNNTSPCQVSLWWEENRKVYYGLFVTALCFPLNKRWLNTGQMASRQRHAVSTMCRRQYLHGTSTGNLLKPPSFSTVRAGHSAEPPSPVSDSRPRFGAICPAGHGCSSHF